MEKICKLKDIYKSLYNFEKEFAETNGITINEGMILCCMKDGSPKLASELYDFVGLSGSRVSRVIHAVENKGFIVREMGVIDKRQMIFSLTELGRRKIKEMQKEKMDLSELRIQLMKMVE
ncbi:MAG: MarR family winged helix-turn-helix transcriptional regulator [Dysgonomonas sp.]